MINRLRRRLPLTILVSFSLLAYHQWLSFSTFLSGDWGQTSYRSIIHSNYYSVWSPLGIGSTNLIFSRLPVEALQYWLGNLFHMGTMVTDKLLFFWPVIVLVPFAGYLLGKLITKNEWTASITGGIFAFNTYFLAINSEGDELITIAAAFCLLAIIYFIKTIRTDEFRNLIFSALFLLAASAFDFRVVYITVFLLLIYALISDLNKITKRFVYLAGLGIILLSLSMFWVLPLKASSSLTTNAAFSRGLFGNSFWSLQASLGLFHPFWTGHTPSWFTAQSVPLFFWILPILAVLGIMQRSRSRLMIYFGAIGILGIFLTKQVDAPFSSIYPLLYAHLPGFNAFREASKFYILIVIAYAALISNLIYKMSASKSEQRKKIGYGIAVVVTCLFIYNLKPLIINDIGTIFKPRHMPHDYSLLNKTLDQQGTFWRTLWDPGISPWTSQNDDHPLIDTADILNNWQTILNIKPGTPIAQQLASEVSQPISKTLISAASFKYIVVPLRDTANNDDFFTYYGNDRQQYIDTLNTIPWLKKVNMNTNNVLIYENMNYKPYITATSNLASVDDFTNINNLYDFSKTQINEQEFNFATLSKGSNSPSAHLKDIFLNSNSDNISGGSIKPDLIGNNSSKEILYANTNHPTLSYTVGNGVLTVSSANPNKLVVDGKLIGEDQPKIPIITQLLSPGQQYYLNEDNNLYPISSPTAKYLGTATSSLKTLSTNGPNLITNGSLEMGLWQKKIQDCNDYDNYSGIGMKLNTAGSGDGHNSLELTALKHIACTGPASEKIMGGNYYRFSLMYKVRGASQGGYIITFNDKNQTKIKFQLPAKAQWTPYMRLIQAPIGATIASIKVLGYPDDQLKKLAVTDYDGLVLQPLQVNMTADVDITPHYTKIPITGTSKISYSDNNYSYRNLIQNSSFNKSLWHTKVGDCNDYDNNPVLAMKLDHKNAPNKKNSLELDATRHTACTGPGPIPVNENTKYSFDFNYQGSANESAGYNITFNDPNHTVVSQELPTADSNWHLFSENLSVPNNATSAVLTVYSYANNPATTNVIIKYTDFHLIQIPDIQGSYFAINRNINNLVKPKQVNYQIISPTKKLVHIKSASTAFYLNMSEAYDGKWQLKMNDSKENTHINALISNVVPADDHYELDGFANGWYVDINKLCKQDNLCTKNADSSYNLNMEIEFTPQHYFYVGLIVSGVTLAGCVGYLGREYLPKRRHFKGWKYVGPR